MEVTILNLKKINKEVEAIEKEQQLKGRIKTHQVLELQSLKEERSKLINSL